MKDGKGEVRRISRRNNRRRKEGIKGMGRKEIFRWLNEDRGDGWERKGKDE